ncbi:MAG TPA: cytochrome c biogenesis protein CcdA [Candidatus Gastranaerophilales bacterium]|nr:cytochrome c biogenesis protein CcdA [Candidatus Gastranaerophilales bacterium]
MENTVIQLFTEQAGQISVWILLAVFAGGIISSISPCTLGILPIIIGYIGGYSENTTKKTIIQLLFFIVGISLVLTTLGIIAAFTGKTLGFHSNPFVGLMIGSIILIMGLTLLEVIEIPMPVLIKQMPQNRNNNLILYPLMLGGTFALASTPCSTPILAGIMAYASLKSNITAGALMLFIYALGQSAIILFAGLFTSLFKKISVIKVYTGVVNKFSGVILIFASLIIYFKIFGII